MLTLFFIREVIRNDKLDKSFWDFPLKDQQTVANVVTDYSVSVLKEYQATKNIGLLEDLPWMVLSQLLPYQTRLDNTDVFLNELQPTAYVYEKFLDYASNQWIFKTCQKQLEALKQNYYTSLPASILERVGFEDLQTLLKQIETHAQLLFMTGALKNPHVLKAMPAFLESPIFKGLLGNPDLIYLEGYHDFCLFVQALGLHDFGFSAFALSKTKVRLETLNTLYDLENGIYRDGQLALYFVEQALHLFEVD